MNGDIVYAVFGGAYSDWYCVGFFDNEEDAYKFCAEHNDNCDAYDVYYVKQLDKITCDFGNDTYFYKYSARVFKDGEVASLFVDECVKIPEKRKILNKGYDWVLIEFCMTSIDNEKAMKIARDIYAEYKAKQNGVI